jgi:hypothetical protein
VSEQRTRGSSFGPGWVALVLVVTIVGSLTIWSFADRHADIPVISKIVCSMKGGTFTEGSPPLGIAAGCYDISAASEPEMVVYRCEFCYPVTDPPGWPQYHDLNLGDPPYGFPAIVAGTSDHPCFGFKDASGVHCVSTR